MKAHFEGPYDVRLLDDGRMAQLLSDLTFIDRNGVRHTARAGFKFDGGSIPRFFWRMIGPPFTGRARKAYPIHDWECAYVRTLPTYKQRWAERKKVDGTLYEMCRALKVNKACACAVYRGVRIGAVRVLFPTSCKGE